jgi:hypothetical protein
MGTRRRRRSSVAKGAGLAEMTRLGIPVPPGFTITTEVCNGFYDAGGGDLDDALRGEIRESLARVGRAGRHALRRPRAAAAGLGALGRPRLHARHDGHHLEPRAERRHRRGPREAHRNRASRYDAYRRFILAYADVVLEVRREHFEHALEEARRDARSAMGIDTSRLNASELVRKRARLGARRGRRCVVWCRPEGDRRERDGQAFPDDPMRSSGARSARCFAAGTTARQGLPRHARHPRELGHRVQRAGDGLRQPGRRLGHGRGVHARSLHGRAALLRRVAAQRAGRRRGRGRAHAAPRGQGRRRRREVARGFVAGGLRRARGDPTRSSRATSATCRTWSSPSRTRSSTCSSAAPENARHARPCASPSRW